MITEINGKLVAIAAVMDGLNVIVVPPMACTCGAMHSSWTVRDGEVRGSGCAQLIEPVGNKGVELQHVKH